MKTEVKVLYEDEHMLAVDKPAGVASVPAPNIKEYRTMQGIVREWAVATGKDYKPYLLNRLDRQTSGVILFGKFPRDRAKLEAIFQDPRTEKTYLAIVKGVPRFQESTIRIPLEARTTDKKVPAITHYKILKKMGLVSLLEIKIDTGRKHQIRKHMAMIHNPLLLDPEYGDREFDHRYQRSVKGKGKMFLHAWQFKFWHPFLDREVIILAKADEVG